MEVKRLQHRINIIIAHIGKEEPEATERQSTDDLQSLQDRIKSITLVVDALDCSCSAETAVAFCQQARLRNLPKRDGPRQQPRQKSRSRRSQLRPLPVMLRRVSAPRGNILTVTQRGGKTAVHNEAKTLPPQITKEY